MRYPGCHVCGDPPNWRIYRYGDPETAAWACTACLTSTLLDFIAQPDDRTTFLICWLATP